MVNRNNIFIINISKPKQFAYKLPLHLMMKHDVRSNILLITCSQVCERGDFGTTPLDLQTTIKL